MFRMSMTKRSGPKISPHTRGGFYTTLTVNGDKKFLYGKTEEEVKAKYIEALYLNGQGYNISKNPTMRDYAVRWFNIFKKGKGALKTQEVYINAINVHIIPALGNKKIKEVTTSDIQQLLNNTNSSHSLQHKVRMTLNQIFKKAQADRLVSFNPVTGTDPVDTPAPARLCYTPEQRKTIFKVLQDNKMFPLIFGILNTGLRVTEAIALMQKRDLDLENKKIVVRESTEFVNSKPGKKSTKTKRGIREIPIPSDFVTWLKDYIKRTKSLYVFPGHHGGQMGQTELKNMQRRANRKLQNWFDEAQKVQKKAVNGDKLTNEETEILNWIKGVYGDDSNIEEFRFKLHFKTLRHTYCTELFDLDIDEVSAATIMGHTVTIMREIYTHIQKERKIQTIQRIEGLYNVKHLPTPGSKSKA